MSESEHELDASSFTISELAEAIEEGIFTCDEVLEAELASENPRKGVLALCSEEQATSDEPASDLGDDVPEVEEAPAPPTPDPGPRDRGRDVPDGDHPQMTMPMQSRREGDPWGNLPIQMRPKGHR